MAAVSRRKRELDMETTSSQSRVDDYFRKNPLTGDPFKDIGGLLATREDRKRSMLARQQMDTEEDRGVTRRGQDIQLELGRGELGVNREKNRITEKFYDQNYEVEKGGLNLNRDIFDQSVARYNKYGEPMDKLNVSQKAMEVKAIGDEFAYGESNALKSLRPEFLADENSTFKPAKIYDENDIAFNYVPDEVQPEFDSSAAFPEYLRKKDWQSYSNPAIGALNEGAKSVMRGVDLGLQYLRPVEDVMMGMKPGASARAVARPAVRNKLRRRVIK